MFGSEELQRWAGRLCLTLVAGFAILAGVCYAPRTATGEARSLRPSGQHPAI
jgi:hypothetical protein